MGYQKYSVSTFILILLVLTVIGDAAPWEHWRAIETMLELEGIAQEMICGSCNFNDTICSDNMQYVSALNESGHYDLRTHPISANKYNVSTMTFSTIQTNGYFQFPNTAQNGWRGISGLLATPDNTTAIRGLVISFHGTLFARNDSPSIKSPSNKKYYASASIYGANNLAVLYVDYLGFGLDDQHVHPYVLYPHQNVKAAIYLLNQAVFHLRRKYPDIPLSPADPLPLMSTGYSQGGAYGIYFGACNTPSQDLPFCQKDVFLDKSYRIVGISGSDGSYDNFNVAQKFMLNDVGPGLNNNQFRSVTQLQVNTKKPWLASLAFISLATYNPKPFDFKDALQPQYFAMNCTGTPQSNCDIGNMHINMQQALSQQTATRDLAVAISNSATGKQNNGYKYLSYSELSTSSKNNFKALLNKRAYDTDELRQALKDSTIVDFGDITPYPTFVFSLVKDSLVSPLNTINFLRHNKLGRVFGYLLPNQKFMVCSAPTSAPVQIDHVPAYILSNIFVLNFFEYALKNTVSLHQVFQGQTKKDLHEQTNDL